MSMFFIFSFGQLDYTPTAFLRLLMKCSAASERPYLSIFSCMALVLTLDSPVSLFFPATVMLY